MDFSEHSASPTCINGVYIENHDDVIEALGDLLEMGYTEPFIEKYSGVTRSYLKKAMRLQKKLKRKQYKQYRTEMLNMNANTPFLGTTIAQPSNITPTISDVRPLLQKPKLSKCLGSKEWLNNLTLEDSSDDDSEDEQRIHKHAGGQHTKLQEIQRIKEEKLKQIEKLKQMIKEKENQKLQQQTVLSNTYIDDVARKEAQIAIDKKMAFLAQVEKLANISSAKVKGLENEIGDYAKLIEERKSQLANETARVTFYQKKIKEVKETVLKMEQEKIRQEQIQQEKKLGQEELEKERQKETNENVGLVREDSQIEQQREKIHQLEMEIEEQKSEIFTDKAVNATGEIPVGKEPLVEAEISTKEKITSVEKNIQSDNNTQIEQNIQIDNNIPIEQNIQIDNNIPIENSIQTENDTFSKQKVPEENEGFVKIAVSDSESNIGEDELISHTKEDIETDNINMKPVEDGDKEQNNTFAPFQSSLTAFKSYKFSPFFQQDSLMSKTWNNTIDYGKPFCPNETAGGQCNDTSCTFQHFKNIEISEKDIIREVARSFPNVSKESQAKYKEELKKFLDEKRLQGKNTLTFTQLIVEFRRSKMAPDSFLDWLEINKQKKSSS